MARPKEMGMLCCTNYRECTFLVALQEVPCTGGERESCWDCIGETEVPDSSSSASIPNGFTQAEPPLAPQAVSSQVEVRVKEMEAVKGANPDELPEAGELSILSKITQPLGSGSTSLFLF